MVNATNVLIMISCFSLLIIGFILWLCNYIFYSLFCLNIEFLIKINDATSAIIKIEKQKDPCLRIKCFKQLVRYYEKIRNKTLTEEILKKIEKSGLELWLSS